MERQELILMKGKHLRGVIRDGRPDEFARILHDPDLPRFINSKGSKGFTPLHWASTTGRVGMAKALLVRGANVALKDDKGCFPLHYAKTPDVANLLVDNGADVNACADYGVTPLHMASQKGNIQMVESFIANGADVNAQNQFGNAPLHIVGTKECAEMLVHNGADATLQNKQGLTPLDLATPGSATHDFLSAQKKTPAKLLQRFLRISQPIAVDEPNNQPNNPVLNHVSNQSR